MSKAIFYNAYKLKKGASVPDFLLAIEKLTEAISKEKGFVSCQLVVDGETWADMSTWETMEDAKNFAKAGGPKDLAEKFYSFINLNSCRSHFYEVVK